MSQVKKKREAEMGDGDWEGLRAEWASFGCKTTDQQSTRQAKGNLGQERGTAWNQPSSNT